MNQRGLTGKRPLAPTTSATFFPRNPLTLSAMQPIFVLSDWDQSHGTISDHFVEQRRHNHNLRWQRGGMKQHGRVECLPKECSNPNTQCQPCQLCSAHQPLTAQCLRSTPSLHKISSRQMANASLSEPWTRLASLCRASPRRFPFEVWYDMGTSGVNCWMRQFN